MDLLSVLTGYVLTGIKKSKAVETVTNDFSDAISSDLIDLWKKIKPIFIVEDAKLVEKIEKDPNDAVAQGGITYKLSQKLDQDEAFKKMVLDIVTEIQKKEEENKPKGGIHNTVHNTGNQNIIVQGSNISGHINKS